MICWIRAIYVDINDVDSYFAYAEKSGIETDISVLQRDSLKFTAAEKIYLSGNFAKAIPALEGYIESYPNGVRTTDATYYLGDSQLQTGDKSGAIEQFQKLAQMTRNEFTLRILWILASLYDSRYISVVVCFAAFFANDIYGYLNWKKMQIRQNEHRFD